MHKAWERTSLGEVVTFAAGYAFPIEHQGKTEGTWPFYKVSDMNASGNERGMSVAINYVGSSAQKLLRFKVWPSKTVIFPKVGAALLTEKRRFLTTESVFDNNIMGLVAGPRIIPEYLFAFMGQIRLGDYAQHGAVPSINKSHVAQLEILLPPREEQRRIVDLIGALDETIDAADAQTTSLKRASSALRHKIFAELTNTCPASTAGQFFDVTLGRQKSARQLHGDHEIPYIRAANISDGSLSLLDVQSMNFDPKEQLKYGLQNGDVLVVEGGSVGQTAVWRGELEGPVGFDKHVLRIRGVEPASTSSYANQWARWCYETGRFATEARGITILALGFQRAKSMPVPAATLARQLEVAQLLESSDAATSASASASTSLRSLRAQLLSALLSGAHRIPEAYDELMGA
jgi:hypothetical protein